jgi:pimeloyl-ACP methyl ester carboxylesterase
MALGYDEFSMFEDNATEVGLAWSGPPQVERVSVDVGDGQTVSALLWGGAPPEIVLIHGGAQNAHTWDTVALALDRPLVAIDLPGHGHSSWREDKAYFPPANVAAVASAVRQLAPDAAMVVGMSLGGMTSIALAAQEPDLVRKLTLVDVTPGVDHEKASAITAFIAGPERFSGFDEILARTIEFNPTRSESSLRRGVLHNAHELPDGQWSWRYDRFELPEGATGPDFSALWADVARLTMPIMLTRGADSPVVDDADVAEFLRLQPNTRVEVVEGSGHSIQGDQPLELARLLADFVTG